MADASGSALRALLWPAYANRSGNPYNRLLAGGLEAQGVDVAEFSVGRLLSGRYPVCHIHWLDSVIEGKGRGVALRARALLALLRLAQQRGTHLVWTVHNLASHEHRHAPAHAWFWRRFVQCVDLTIHLSAVGQEEALARYPPLRERPAVVIPHGHYRDVYLNTTGRQEARARLGLGAEEKVLLHLGFLRAYKNVPHLIHCVRAMEERLVRLVVAGRPATEAVEQAIREAAGADERVRLDLHFVAEEDVQVYLNAADLVVLPYRDILNSGSALLALSFDRPVLVPALGAMSELRAQVGAEWVHTYAGTLEARHLAEVLGAIRTRPPSGRAPLAEFDWATIAAQTRRAYLSLR